ncbi:hypothetical protein M3Y94_01124300 [Aphelenchoides besseyi]|nr:hypothetical protein M3Y94_01124300 [Aphelenchoides besseyi]
MKSIVLLSLILLFNCVVKAELPTNREDEDEEDDSDSNFLGDNIQTSFIENSFNNERSFACQLVKSALRTGDSGANLSPEDINIVGVMGDALSTGIGLWGGVDIEFRGAAFTSGGDATIDGLVTFPNILSSFSPNLEGISHGMGTADKLPDYQFDVAASGGETDTMPQQAMELIRRIQRYHSTEDLTDKWVMILITVGTEELCAKCDEPNVKALRTALVALRKAIPRAFVVVIGPVHVARSSYLNYNLLKPRCRCLNRLTNKELRQLQTKWKDELLKLEVEFSSRNYTNFPVVMLPRLTIESRHPEQLFISGHPLLNRKGHSYAAKWLWNRLIAGPKYNASKIPLSEDTYYCPPVVCPYFRTPANYKKCSITTLDEYKRLRKVEEANKPKRNQTLTEIRRDEIRQHIGFWIIVPIVLSAIVVFIFGAIFYCHGMKATKGRFENVPGL